MKYGVCFPPLLGQRVPQVTEVCLCGVLPVSDWTGEGGERGCSSPVARSASLPVNVWPEINFQILPISVLEDQETAGSEKKEKPSLKR